MSITTQPRGSGELIGFALGIVVVHLALNFAHGIAHGRLAIGLNGFQKFFVAAIVIVAPLFAAYLILQGRLRAGGALLAVAMAGALVFGVYYHFILPGPDHIMRADLHISSDWRDIFDFTAVLLALTECLGLLAGVRLFSKSETRA